MKKIFFIIALISLGYPAIAKEEFQSRFFYSGDGKININSAHTKSHFRGVYRNKDGAYDKSSSDKLNKVFGVKKDQDVISMRLIEFLDYLEDKFKGKRVTVISGYRSPEYNDNLRRRGALAGKASLHQYGMASDIIMEGVESKKIWDYVKNLGFGGAGYYHGKSVHIDVGPARFWDEKTSRVGEDIADDNKLIMISTDRDIYLAGEEIILSFARMTVWPIGVAKFFLEGSPTQPTSKGKIKKFTPYGRACKIFEDANEMRPIKWQIPSDALAGRYKIKVEFCGKKWVAMPREITTAEFEVFNSHRK